MGLELTSACAQTAPTKLCDTAAEKEAMVLRFLLFISICAKRLEVREKEEAPPENFTKSSEVQKIG